MLVCFAIHRFLTCTPFLEGMQLRDLFQIMEEDSYMLFYDYEAGKKRIDCILASQIEIVEQDKIPPEDVLVMRKGYYGLVTALYVNIRASTALFSDEDKLQTAKIIRSFTSETIEILRGFDFEREIGIRGDCIYAIYTTPLQTDVNIVLDIACYVNTFMKMLNLQLAKRELPPISVGIGIATDREMVINAGRKEVGINDRIWIGNAGKDALNLSYVGNKDGVESIVMSADTFDSIIGHYLSEYGEKAREWFFQRSTQYLGTFYDTGLIISDYSEWIEKEFHDIRVFRDEFEELLVQYS